jgi:DNA/RNA-binding domain of Phe-tRNA-synthetase-like protein
MTPIAISPGFGAAGVPVALYCIEAEVVVEDSSFALRDRLGVEVEEVNAALAVTPLAEFAAVAAARRAYRAMGKDPTRYRVSSEALIRRISQGKGLYRINNVVEVNNLVSLHTRCAVGSYRIDALTPPIEFRPGHDGESYQAIARGSLNLAHLPLFADASGPFGSPTSDSERTMISPGAGRILMVVIDFRAQQTEDLDFAVAAIKDYCSGETIETSVLRNEI